MSAAAATPPHVWRWCGKPFAKTQRRYVNVSFCSNQCRSDMVSARNIAQHPERRMPQLTARQRSELITDLTFTARAIRERIRELRSTPPTREEARW